MKLGTAINPNSIVEVKQNTIFREIVLEKGPIDNLLPRIIGDI